MAAAVLPEPPAMAYAAEHQSHQSQIRGSVLAPNIARDSRRLNALPSPTSPAALSPLKLAYPSRSHDSFMSQQSASDASYPSSPTPLTNSHSQHGSRESWRASHPGEARPSRHMLGVEGAHRSNTSSARRDLEKQEQSRSHRTPASASTGRMSRQSYRPEPPPKDILEQKTLRILLYLSAGSVVITFLALFWALMSLVTILILQPLRLFSKRPSLNQQISDFLAPTLNIQLRFVYSSATAENYSVPLLLIIHIFSPIVSFGVALAAWTAGVFWLFCLILGNPDGRDRNNDGSNAVLGVRTWWERWLTRAFR